MSKELPTSPRWDSLPTDDGVPVIKFGNREFRLPLCRLIPQTVSLEALRDSIESNGIQVPILVDEQTDIVVDGMTRLYIAYELGLDPSAVPIDEKAFDDEERWQIAIEMNANRRQLSPSMRRDLIDQIVERKDWEHPTQHVTELSRLLGTSKSTISRDLDKLYEHEDVQELKKRKQRLNQVTSGLSALKELVENDDLISDLGEDGDEVVRQASGLMKLAEDERDQLDDAISRID